MINRHKTVVLDDALAGMVLSEDVLDNRGSMLIPKDTVLADATLTSLRRRGIDILQVVDDALSGEEWAAERERIRTRLAGLFRKYPDNRACAMLRQQIDLYRLGDSE